MHASPAHRCACRQLPEPLTVGGQTRVELVVVEQQQPSVRIILKFDFRRYGIAPVTAVHDQHGAIVRSVTGGLQLQLAVFDLGATDNRRRA